MTAHDGSVTAVAQTPDGLHWVTAGNDSRVRLWDARRCRCAPSGCFWGPGGSAERQGTGFPSWDRRASSSLDAVQYRWIIVAMPGLFADVRKCDGVACDSATQLSLVVPV